MTWEHTGNLYAHAEDFRCTACGRETSISNMSKQYQRAGEPEPCRCDEAEKEHKEEVENGTR